MKPEHKIFIDELKLTGKVFFNGNHFKVVETIAEKFSISREQALAILLEWVKSN